MLGNLLGEDLRTLLVWFIIVTAVVGIVYGIIRWGK